MHGPRGLSFSPQRDRREGGGGGRGLLSGQAPQWPSTDVGWQLMDVCERSTAGSGVASA